MAIRGPASPVEGEPGSRFGKYELTRRLAHGGMAEVFLATVHGEAGFSKPVVIKRLHPRLSEDREFVNMLIDEARITAQLTHGNICQVLDLGAVEGSYYIAMEFVAGEELRAVHDHFIRADQRFPIDAAVFVVSEVLAGLEYAHRKEGAEGEPLHIIHRDVSPQNILMSYEGEVKLIDFGIAKARSRMVKTQAGVIKGKFRYMSPEQASGAEIDHRSDVFAAGVVLYELLRNEPHLTDVPDTEALRRMREADLEPLDLLRPDLPKELVAVVHTALARRPDARYQSAEEFRDALVDLMRESRMTFGRRELTELMRDRFSTKRRQERGGSVPGAMLRKGRRTVEPTEAMPSDHGAGAGLPVAELAARHRERQDGRRDLRHAGDREAMARDAREPTAAMPRDAVEPWAGDGPHHRLPQRRPGPVHDARRASRRGDVELDSGSGADGPIPSAATEAQTRRYAGAEDGDPSAQRIERDVAAGPHATGADDDHGGLRGLAQRVRRAVTSRRSTGSRSPGAPVAGGRQVAQPRPPPRGPRAFDLAGWRPASPENATSGPSSTRDTAEAGPPQLESTLETRLESDADEVAEQQLPRGARRTGAAGALAWSAGQGQRRPPQVAKQVRREHPAPPDVQAPERAESLVRKVGRDMVHGLGKGLGWALTLGALVAILIGAAYVAKRMGLFDMGGEVRAVLPPDGGPRPLFDAARAGSSDVGENGAGDHGVIRLISRPAGARISVCGEQTEHRTPATVKVPAGVPCTVELWRPGFARYRSDEVVVRVGRRTRIVAVLRRLAGEPRQPRAPLSAPDAAAVASDRGELIVTSVDLGTVFVNGQRAGRTPRLSLLLAPGSYIVRVRFDSGEAPRPKQVQIRAGRQSQTHFDSR